MARGRHTPRRRTRRALFVGAAVAVLVLAAGGAAYSAYRYEMANADRILPGGRIGSRSVIGAGSVVTRDIPDGVFAAGNPCRVIRELAEVERAGLDVAAS